LPHLFTRYQGAEQAAKQGRMEAVAEAKALLASKLERFKASVANGAAAKDEVSFYVTPDLLFTSHHCRQALFTLNPDWISRGGIRLLKACPPRVLTLLCLFSLLFS
jgi:hypothetical protein